MKCIFSLLILVFSTNLSCLAQNLYAYRQPTELDDGWKTNNLRSVAIDTTRLYSFFNQIMKANHQLHSVLLIKNDHLVVEEYFSKYDANKLHDLRSVNKSIKSILLGIALDKGFIDDINDPISKYLKDYSPEKNLDERKKEITLKHLITMSAGWDCDDWSKKSKGQEDRVYKKDDWIQYTLDLPLINDPGEVSTYCSMCVIILAEIISQASGLTIENFAEKYLLEPLGINNYEWGHTAEKVVIPSGRRLYLRPRDLAKIGQLVLRKGTWDNKQIVSANWIEMSTATQTAITGLEYGYLWWNFPFPTKEETLVSKTATGNGGQYIFILPTINLIAVFTGGAYNSSEDKLAFAAMKDVFIPSFHNEIKSSNKGKLRE